MIKNTIFFICSIVLLFFAVTHQTKYEAAQNISIKKENITENKKFYFSSTGKNITEDVTIVIGAKEEKGKIYIMLLIENLAKQEIMFEAMDIEIGDSANIYTLKVRLAEPFTQVKDGILIDLVGFDGEVIKTVNLSDFIEEDFTMQ